MKILEVILNNHRRPADSIIEQWCALCNMAHDSSRDNADPSEEYKYWYMLLLMGEELKVDTPKW